MAKNYYAILGLACGATAEDIKSAYRRLAKEFHPDRYRGGGRPFLEVQEAYSVLGDADRRARYDQSLAVRPARPYAGWGKPVSPSEPEPLIPAARPADFGDISPVRSFETFTPSFDEIFDWLWSNFRSLSQPKSERLQSLTVEVPVTPEEAHRGGQARILVPAQARCPTCRGYGGVGTLRVYAVRRPGCPGRRVPCPYRLPAGSCGRSHRAGLIGAVRDPQYVPDGRLSPHLRGRPVIHLRATRPRATELGWGFKQPRRCVSPSRRTAGVGERPRPAVMGATPELV